MKTSKIIKNKPKDQKDTYIQGPLAEVMAAMDSWWEMQKRAGNMHRLYIPDEAPQESEVRDEQG